METISLNDLQLDVIEVLGEGGFGQVLKAIDQLSVALKLIRKDRTQLESFLQELQVSVLVGRHESIVYTYPIHVLALDHFVIMQDFAPCGTLHSIIDPQSGVPVEIMKRCAEQLASALFYMHSKHQLIHGDLKPDNVLLMDKDCHQIKLADFGHARCIGQLLGRMSHIIPYMCPELCHLQENEYLYLTQSVDVWAFGILLYVALTGYFPWEKALKLDHCFNEFAEWQNGGDYAALPNGWEAFTGEAMSMFSRLLSLDPVTRPTFEHYGFLGFSYTTSLVFYSCPFSVFEDSVHFSPFVLTLYFLLAEQQINMETVSLNDLQLDVIEVIGEGGFGQVLKAIDQLSEWCPRDESLCRAALCYMHRNQLIHGDLKPDNALLMDKDCHHKLEDWSCMIANSIHVP